MYVIMGANGHVGSAVAETLLARGEPVTVVTHSNTRTDAWQSKGAEVAMADVNDVASLRAVLRRGRRAFLLNPPADISTDTDAVERATVTNILAALDGSGLEKVVAESTGAAQPASASATRTLCGISRRGCAGRQSRPRSIAQDTT